MNNFIHWMYENKLFINDSIVYDNMDGYSNQCICANEKWIWYVLLFTHRLITDIWIIYPDHVRIKIYGINGAIKTYLKGKCVW